ncbi:MAG: Ribosomal small subunit methyltransferase [Massilibacillus sp.]|jgi:16S rRNA (guanine527-N7)-methyltransferase|nr:Ribosomal small subunit methyltransferase [Massilibacillus sp.]
MSFADYLRAAAQTYNIALTDEQVEAYCIYYELLIEWNEKINLTAITQPEQVAVKHMIDSLSCHNANVFFEGCSVIDVGTGAGFPGLPLKIFQENIQLTLLDSLNKRVKFLATVVETLQLNKVEAIHSRAEEGSRQKVHREKYDVAVSRAVARLNVLCELCMPYVKVGGYFVALKGAQYVAEVDEAKRAVVILGGEIEKIVPVKLPGIDDVRAIIYVKKIKQTPVLYPRKAGTPEKDPL